MRAHSDSTQRGSAERAHQLRRATSFRSPGRQSERPVDRSDPPLSRRLSVRCTDRDVPCAHTACSVRARVVQTRSHARPRRANSTRSRSLLRHTLLHSASPSLDSPFPDDAKQATARASRRARRRTRRGCASERGDDAPRWWRACESLREARAGDRDRAAGVEGETVLTVSPSPLPTVRDPCATIPPTAYLIQPSTARDWQPPQTRHVRKRRTASRADEFQRRAQTIRAQCQSAPVPALAGRRRTAFDVNARRDTAVGWMSR
ncbi:hypothetical protein AcV7_008405 [Taiwanofungus camphoratus]|nr:hypothetical protein AcV7_008405 [Antrodia cinnamomea]